MNKDYEVRFTAEPRLGSVRDEITVRVDTYTPTVFSKTAGEMSWAMGTNIAIPRSEIPALIAFLQGLQACTGCNAEAGEECRWGCLSHEREMYYHEFDSVPTSEPCSGLETCPDCIEVREENERILREVQQA